MLQTASGGNAARDCGVEAQGEWQQDHGREMLDLPENIESSAEEEQAMHDVLIAMSYMAMVLAPCVTGFVVLPTELSEED